MVIFQPLSFSLRNVSWLCENVGCTYIVSSVKYHFKFCGLCIYCAECKYRALLNVNEHYEILKERLKSSPHIMDVTAAEQRQTHQRGPPDPASPVHVLSPGAA